MRRASAPLSMNCCTRAAWRLRHSPGMKRSRVWPRASSADTWNICSAARLNRQTRWWASMLTMASLALLTRSANSRSRRWSWRSAWRQPEMSLSSTYRQG
jgi:hypothetical protein